MIVAALLVEDLVLLMAICLLWGLLVLIHGHRCFMSSIVIKSSLCGSLFLTRSIVSVFRFVYNT